MKKKSIAILICVMAACLSCFIFAFNNQFKINLDSGYDPYLKEDYLEKIDDYQSEVTRAYKNKDGTVSVCFYSIPVNYSNSIGKLKEIDTRIKNTVNENDIKDGYAYTVAENNIIPLFPKKLTGSRGIKLIHNEFEYDIGLSNIKSETVKYKENCENFIGNKVNALRYESSQKEIGIQVYPSLVGFNCELDVSSQAGIDHSKLTMWLKTDPLIEVNKEQGGYLTLRSNNDIVGVIQAPIVKTSSGSFLYNNSINITASENGFYELELFFDNEIAQEDFKAFLSFEMRREKQPDNAIYSNKADLKNAFLSNRSIIGSSDDYGTGRLMIRYKLSEILGKKPENVVSAHFYIYSLTNNNKAFELNPILEEWCSVEGNWNNHYKFGESIAQALNDNMLSFDITEEVKKWINDETGTLEDYGLLMKAKEENAYDIILNNDNTLHLNYTEIVIKE